MEEEEEEEDDDDGEDPLLQANALETGHSRPLAVDFSQSPTLVDNLYQPLVTEQSPLLKHPRARSTSQRRTPRRLSSAAGEQHGDATVTQAVLMVIFITQTFREP